MQHDELTLMPTYQSIVIEFNLKRVTLLRTHEELSTQQIYAYIKICPEYTYIRAKMPGYISQIVSFELRNVVASSLAFVRFVTQPVSSGSNTKFSVRGPDCTTAIEGFQSG